MKSKTLQNNDRLYLLHAAYAARVKVGDVINGSLGLFVVEEIGEYKGSRVAYYHQDGKKYMSYLSGLLPSRPPKCWEMFPEIARK